MTYLLTLEASDFGNLFQPEESLSIFCCPSFECRLNNCDDSSQHSVVAQVHPSSVETTSNQETIFILPKRLIFSEAIPNIDETIEEEGEVIELLVGEGKVGGQPALVQGSRESKKLSAEKYALLFQLNEEYLPPQTYSGSSIFGHGTLYVYAKILDGKLDIRDVKLFWQNA